MIVTALLAFVILNVIYLLGFFLFSITLKTAEVHYFLGFNPCLFSFNIKNTKFSIGLYIPIVGLARIYSVINGEKLRARYPWEFFNVSVPKRILATLGGAVFLFISGILIFISVTYFQKESIISKEEMNKHGIYPSAWAKEIGFQRGDKILSINGKDFTNFYELYSPEVLTNPDSYYTIGRDGKEIDLKINGALEKLNTRNEYFILLDVPFEIMTVMPGQPADLAGIIPGDQIKKVNGKGIVKINDMMEAFAEDADGQVDLEIERKENNETKILMRSVTLNHEKKIGVQPKELIEYTIKENTLLEAVQKGTDRALSSLVVNIKASIKLTGGELNSRRKLSGPISITPVNNFYFWTLTGFNAMWYAFWNLLPLPKSALWELIALGYEGIFRKKYSLKLFHATTTLSWIFLGALFVLIIVNDIIKLFQ